jgi:hypothetical protein
VIISQPGSYRLSSNLTVPDELSTAIVILADNVTLDLNGFSILGPTVCSGVPLACAPRNGGTGVFAGTSGGASSDNLTVVNGTIRGFGRGVFARGDNVRVEHVRAVSNDGSGIMVGRGGTVSGNTASHNFRAGIDALDGSTVRGNVSSDNFLGITVGAGSIVDGNTVLNNGTIGISALVIGAVVNGNTAMGNGGVGLLLGGTVGYMQNVLTGNLGPVNGGVSLGQNLCDGIVC